MSNNILDYEKLDNPFDDYPNWVLYKRITNKSQKVPYWTDSGKEYNLNCRIVNYLLRFELGDVLETDLHKYQFQDEFKNQIGIFRFPIDVEGEEVDLVLNNPEALQQLPQEKVAKFLSSEIISINLNKIEVVCFDYLLLPEEEFKQFETKAEQEKVREYQKEYYKKQLKVARETIANRPDYLKILKGAIDKKITAEKASSLSDGIISREII